jgi:hypothetical protein
LRFMTLSPSEMLQRNYDWARQKPRECYDTLPNASTPAMQAAFPRHAFRPIFPAFERICTRLGAYG